MSLQPSATTEKLLYALEKHISLGLNDFEDESYADLMYMLCEQLNQSEKETLHEAFVIAFAVVNSIGERYSPKGFADKKFGQFAAAIYSLTILNFQSVEDAKSFLKTVLVTKIFRHYRNDFNRRTLAMVVHFIDLSILNACEYLESQDGYVSNIIEILNDTVKLCNEPEQRWFMMVVIRKVYELLDWKDLLQFYTMFDVPPKEFMELINQRYEALKLQWTINTKGWSWRKLWHRCKKIILN